MASFHNIRMRILLIQTSFLGDVILSTPVIVGIKKLYPEAEIYVMTTPLASGLLKGHPLITEVLPFEKRGKHRGYVGIKKFVEELKKYNFNKVYSLHRSWRTSFLVWLLNVSESVGFSDAFGARWAYKKLIKKASLSEHAVIRYLSLLFGDAPRDFFSTKLSLPSPSVENFSPEFLEFLSEPYICLFPGSEWFTKRWQRFSEIAISLINAGYRVIVLGSKKEANQNQLMMKGIEVLHLSGKTTMSETMAIVSRASGVICNDSMALHMASAFEVPRVSVFCSTSPTFGFGPWGKYGSVAELSELPCKPCRRHGSQKCPNGTNRCMTGVSPGIVYEKLIHVIAEAQRAHL